MLLEKMLSNPVCKLFAKYFLFILFLLAIVLRLALYPTEVGDYQEFLSPWYDFIYSHGGFAALKNSSFSNYNIPYLFLLACTTYFSVPNLIAIKTLSVLFDGELSLFTYLILKSKYPRSGLPVIGALVILFAPTIFINSALWGQCDGIYATFCLGSLYFLLKQCPRWACVFFSIAISFKLQAIFFLPVLLGLLLRKKIRIRHLFLIPLIFLIMISPALLAGRSLISVLTIYPEQIAMGAMIKGISNKFIGGGQNAFGTTSVHPDIGGNFQRTVQSPLAGDSPSLYRWLPPDAPPEWKWLGIALAALFVILIGILLVRSKQELTNTVLLKIAMVFVIAIPFFLPSMHERYFYLADVFSIVYAFYFPRLFPLALGTQFCSFISYVLYLGPKTTFGTTKQVASFILKIPNIQYISLDYLTAVALIIIIITLIDLTINLYPKQQLAKPLQTSSKILGL